MSLSPLFFLKFRPVLLALFVSSSLCARGEELAEAWANRYHVDGRSSASGKAVKVDADGNIIAAGEASGVSSRDCYVAKYAGGDGALLWENRSHGPRRSSAWTSGIALDAHGNVALVGTIYDKSGTLEQQRPYYDYYIARFAAKDGALLWERRYDGPGHRSDYSRAVAVDAQGNVFVTGISQASGPGPGEDIDSLRKNPPRTFFIPPRPDEDIVTLKYAAEDGRLLWERRYDNGHHGQDFGHTLSVDAKGDVVVAGVTELRGIHLSGYLAKYAGETGEPLWEKQIGDGDVGSFGCQRLDTHGDLLVTGSLREVNDSPGALPTTTDKGMFIAKYAGTDGTRLWQWAAPPGLSLTATFDAEGAVLIYGTIAVQGSDIQDYTAKLSGADGKLVWSAAVPRRGKVEGKRLAVDAHGDFVVAGALHRGDNMGDLYAAKYSGTDGKLLWSHITEGPVQVTAGSRISGPYWTLGGLTLTHDGGVVICGDSISADRTANCMATIFFAPVGRAPKGAQPERAQTTHGTTMPGGTTLTYSAAPIAPQKPSPSPGKLRALEAWRRQHFGDRAGIEAFAGDRADPNRNGIINLLEYALGGDPLGPGSTAVLPQLEFDENGRARLRFHRYASHDDLLMVVSAADNPSGPWSPLAHSIAGGRFFIQTAGAAAEESGEADERTVLVTDVFSAGDSTHPQRYLRLEVVR